VLRCIARFLISNQPKIQLIRAQRGGWEAWLQVELALILHHDVHFGQLYAIEREQPVFTDSRQRVDICGIPRPGAPTVPPFLGIELKVESAFQTGAQGGLVSRYSDDIRKCSMGPRDDLRSASGTTMYAVGVTTLANDLTGYQEVANQNRGDFFWVELVPGSLYMISWRAAWADER
jgi:hypothetical protein